MIRRENFDKTRSKRRDGGQVGVDGCRSRLKRTLVVFVCFARGTLFRERKRADPPSRIQAHTFLLDAFISKGRGCTVEKGSDELCKIIEVFFIHAGMITRSPHSWMSCTDCGHLKHPQECRRTDCFAQSRRL